MLETIQPFVPVMSKERFAKLSGLSEPTVRGMIEKGHIPAIKIGKRRLVNVVALIKEAGEEE
ncbi:MAG: helix-turn-helix domain-containing protein [Sedimenticola sp.]